MNLVMNIHKRINYRANLRNKNVCFSLDKLSNLFEVGLFKESDLYMIRFYHRGNKSKVYYN